MKNDSANSTSEHGVANVLGNESAASSRLKEAAALLFAERGLDGVSTRDIAKSAGLNISLISYYFGGKEGLYKAVITDFAMKTYGEFNNTMAGFDPQNFDKKIFSQKMKKIIGAIVHNKMNSPFIAKILQREMLSGLPYSKDIYENIFKEMAEKIVGLLVTAQKKGILRSDIHAHLLFISLIHSVDSYLVANQCVTDFMRFCPKLPEESSVYADHLYKIFIEGALV